MSEQIGFELNLDLGFDEAIEAVTAALKQEGFGVLTRIDVHTTLKQKIDVDFRPYTILGACNPALAHKALTARAEVGLMLPCNVTVEQVSGGGAPGSKTLVRIINAKGMMDMSGFGDDPAIREIGAEATERLGRVEQSLRGG